MRWPGTSHASPIWDWTFYDTRDTYARPSIALEHENRHDGVSFGDDLWKVLCAGAPLRVMVGYVPGPRALRNRITRTLSDRDYGQRGKGPSARCRAADDEPIRLASG